MPKRKLKKYVAWDARRRRAAMRYDQGHHSRWMLESLANSYYAEKFGKPNPEPIATADSLNVTDEDYCDAMYRFDRAEAEAEGE